MSKKQYPPFIAASMIPSIWSSTKRTAVCDAREHRSRRKQTERICVHDQKREQQERSTFYKRLWSNGSAQVKNLKHWMNPGEVFRATAKRDAKYIEWKAIDGRFQVALRKMQSRRPLIKWESLFCFIEASFLGSSVFRFIEARMSSRKGSMCWRTTLSWCRQTYEPTAVWGVISSLRSLLWFWEWSLRDWWSMQSWIKDTPWKDC